MELAAVPGSPFPAGGNAMDVDVNCANSLLFSVNAGPNFNLIDVFSLASNGGLTPVSGSPFANGTSSLSVAVEVDRNNHLFTSDTFSTDVLSLSIAADGSLFPVPGSPFATSDWTGGLAVSRSGHLAMLTTVYSPGRRFIIGSTFA